MSSNDEIPSNRLSDGCWQHLRETTFGYWTCHWLSDAVWLQQVICLLCTGIQLQTVRERRLSESASFDKVETQLLELDLVGRLACMFCFFS